MAQGPDLAQAKLRIEAALRANATTLDLGRLGLESLDGLSESLAQLMRLVSLTPRTAGIGFR